MNKRVSVIIPFFSSLDEHIHHFLEAKQKNQALDESIFPNIILIYKLIKDTVFRYIWTFDFLRKRRVMICTGGALLVIDISVGIPVSWLCSWLLWLR